MGESNDDVQDLQDEQRASSVLTARRGVPVSRSTRTPAHTRHTWWQPDSSHRLTTRRCCAATDDVQHVLFAELASCGSVIAKRAAQCA